MDKNQPKWGNSVPSNNQSQTEAQGRDTRGPAQAAPVRPLNYDEDAERAVIGAVVMEHNPEIFGVLHESAFYVPAHATLFSVVADMYNRGAAVDELCVRAELQRRQLLSIIGGQEYLGRCCKVAAFGASWNVDEHARIVLSKAQQREMQEALAEAGKCADSGDMRGAVHIMEWVQKRATTARVAIPAVINSGALIQAYPELRPEIIKGYLRRGETANLIAGSKSHKTFFVSNLVMCLSTGRPFLDEIEVSRSNVLVLDNELHKETMSHRLQMISRSLGMHFNEYTPNLDIVNLRGSLKSIDQLAGMLRVYTQEKKYDVIVLDAMYRFLPRGVDENSNADIAALYNQLDCLSDEHDCSFIVVHHFSKGSQAGKKNTDLGAGAGAFTRACDTHMTIMPHPELEDVGILDASLRSFKPTPKIALRWLVDRMVYEIARDVDPNAVDEELVKEKALSVTPAEFAERFVFKKPAYSSEGSIIQRAMEAGMSQSGAKSTFKLCIGSFIRYDGKGNEKKYYKVES